MRLSKLFVKTATLRDGPTFHTLYGFLTVENKASCILTRNTCMQQPLATN